MTYLNRTYAKCIISGEHTVLRGGPAIVFPVHSCFLESKLNKTNDEFEVDFLGPYASEIKFIFWGVIEEALKNVGKKRSDLHGHFSIEDHIPIGGGLGASAAICVAIGRLFVNMNFIDNNELYEFSRNLENMFHGESSGVDIAAAMSTTGGQIFMRGGERTPLEMKWEPNWYLSYSNKKGVTSECVNKVKALIESSPDLGAKIDQQMNEATNNVQKSLQLSESEGLALMANAIDQAAACFRQWHLVDKDLEKHMHELSQLGALAVKPTGSGGGGYVLSLWKNKPPTDLNFQLLPVL